MATSNLSKVRLDKAFAYSKYGKCAESIDSLTDNNTSVTTLAHHNELSDATEYEVFEFRKNNDYIKYERYKREHEAQRWGLVFQVTTVIALIGTIVSLLW